MTKENKSEVEINQQLLKLQENFQALFGNATKLEINEKHTTISIVFNNNINSNNIEEEISKYGLEAKIDNLPQKECITFKNNICSLRFVEENFQPVVYSLTEILNKIIEAERQKDDEYITVNKDEEWVEVKTVEDEEITKKCTSLKTKLEEVFKKTNTTIKEVTFDSNSIVIKGKNIYEGFEKYGFIPYLYKDDYTNIASKVATIEGLKTTYDAGGSDSAVSFFILEDDKNKSKSDLINDLRLILEYIISLGDKELAEYLTKVSQTREDLLSHNKQQHKEEDDKEDHVYEINDILDDNTKETNMSKIKRSLLPGSSITNEQYFSLTFTD